MLEKKIISLYEKTGALQKGHFVLSSGKRSSIYLQSAIVLSYPEHLKTIGKSLTKKIKKIFDYKKIDLVVSPAMGGIVIGSKVGEELGVRAIFVERDGKNFSLRRGFRIKKKEKVLIVEDVVTTGKSSKECSNCIQKNGGVIVGLASIIDRSNKKLNFGIPHISLAKINAPSYTINSLPNELKLIPAEKPGSRKT